MRLVRSSRDGHRAAPFVGGSATAEGETAHGSLKALPVALSGDHWSPQGMRGLDAAFATRALRGVTFSAAAGDAGSTNDEEDGYRRDLKNAD